MTQKLPTLTPADCDAILRRLYGDEHVDKTLEELMNWGQVMIQRSLDKDGKMEVRIRTPRDFTKAPA